MTGAAQELRRMEPATIAAVLAFLVLVFPFATFGVLTWYLPYLALLGATILAVRSVPARPGELLRRQSRRQVLVVMIVATTVGLLAVTPRYAGLQTFLVAALLLLDIALGMATRRLATAPEARVDERQEWVRNRAHRIAYVILATVLVGIVLGANAGGVSTRSWLSANLVWPGFMVVGQMLFVLPAMVLAWLEPDELPDETAAPRPGDGRRVLAGTLVAASVLTPFLLAMSVTLFPVQTSTSTAPSASVGGARCAELLGDKRVGVGMGARLRLHGVACADGTRAYEVWGFNQSDCELYSAAAASVSTLQCSRTTDAQGTMRFVYAARINSTLVPGVTRDVAFHLAMDRTGRVVEFS